MKIKSVFVHVVDEGTPDERLNARATITVPGLGDVSTQESISDELTERIAAECIASLKLKLGQKV